MFINKNQGQVQSENLNKRKSCLLFTFFIGTRVGILIVL